MPHYVATVKMHRNPVSNRYIPSSASSSVVVISVWLNRPCDVLLPEVDKLFATVMKAGGVSANWTHRSWILRNCAEVIPFI